MFIFPPKRSIDSCEGNCMGNTIAHKIEDWLKATLDKSGTLQMNSTANWWNVTQSCQLFNEANIETLLNDIIKEKRKIGLKTNLIVSKN